MGAVKNNVLVCGSELNPACVLKNGAHFLATAVMVVCMLIGCSAMSRSMDNRPSGPIAFTIAQQGFCHCCGRPDCTCHPGPCGVPDTKASKCDQKALARAKDDWERKKKIVDELYAGSADEVKHSTDGVWDFLKDVGMGSYEGLITKGPLTLWLKLYRIQRVKALEKAMNYLKRRQLEGQVGSAEVALEWAEIAGILLTLEQLYEGRGEINEAYQRMDDAKKMRDRGHDMLTEALAALDRYMALLSQCDQQTQAKALQEIAQKIKDDDSDVSNAWNGILSQNPSGGALDDAQHSLQNAKDVLSTGTQTQNAIPILIRAAQHSTGPKQVLLPNSKVGEVAADTQHASDSLSAGMDNAIRWFEQQDQVLQTIQLLVKAIKAAP